MPGAIEPASLLVMGAGRYRFSDFLRAGAPLTLAVLVLIALLVPVFWPFAPQDRAQARPRAAQVAPAR